MGGCSTSYQNIKYVCDSGLKRGEKKKRKKGQKGMQNRSKSMMSSGASCAVNGCNYNQRNLNNLLGMQCFDHMSLFG